MRDWWAKGKGSTWCSRAGDGAHRLDTPAKAFQTRLYEMVFHDQDPSSYVRTMVDETRAGRHDDLLIYRKRLRQKLEEYQKNVPPHAGGALADEENLRRGLPQRYQHRGTIAYLMTLNGPEPLEYRRSAVDYEHYIDKQLRPIADAILPFVGSRSSGSAASSSISSDEAR